MGNIYLQSIELSDIKKVVEEVLENKLRSLTPKIEKGFKLLTRKDTANLLRISLPTLHEWTKEGIITAHRIGNRVLYKQEEINLSLNQIQTSVKRGGYHA